MGIYLIGRPHQADDRAFVGILRFPVDNCQVVFVMNFLLVRTYQGKIKLKGKSKAYIGMVLSLDYVAKEAVACQA